jgi:hypothetical protein
MLSLFSRVERHAFFKTEGSFFVCFYLLYMTRFFCFSFLFRSLFPFSFVVVFSLRRRIFVVLVAPAIFRDVAKFSTSVALALAQVMAILGGMVAASALFAFFLVVARDAVCEGFLV